MSKLPENVLIYGFAFGESFQDIDMEEVHWNLEDRATIIEDVIFSTCVEYDCTWIIAADRYLTEEEVKDTIAFMLDNQIEEEFCLIEFKGI